jgi:S1-C subfamily serine protease
MFCITLSAALAGPLFCAHCFAQDPASPLSTTGLAELSRETQELHNRCTASLVRVSITQSAAAVLDPALKAEFDEWRKSPEAASSGPSSGGRPQSHGEGRGNRGGRNDGPMGGPPGFGPGGPGSGRFGQGGIAGQVRRFLEMKVEKAADANDAARYRGLILRVMLSQSAFQGDLSALLLDSSGYALLPQGLLREAHDPGSNSIKVTLADGTDTTAKFIGANLYRGYSIIQLDKTGTTRSAGWSRHLPRAGEMCLSITAAQGATKFAICSGRTDNLPADAFPIALDDRQDRAGGFVFDVDGNFAGLVPAGGWGDGERLALSAERMQREARFIIKTGKDIEPQPLGVKYNPIELDAARAKQVADLLGNRRAVVVQNVDPGSLAEKAGIKPGDVILTIDNRPLYVIPQILADLATRSGSVPIVILRRDNNVESEKVLSIELMPQDMH